MASKDTYFERPQRRHEARSTTTIERDLILDPGRRELSVRIRLRISLLAAAAVIAIAASAATAAVTQQASWPSYSQSISGNRTQPLETNINPQNVVHLAKKWVFTTHGDVSATPTVSDGAVYFPDWGGYMNALNASTGTPIWQKQISDYGGHGASRNAPLVLGDKLIFGDNAPAEQSDGAHVFAVNRSDGSLAWSTQVDSNRAAIVTSSPVAHGNEIVVGVASNEEVDSTRPNYPCCSFRGAVIALDANTGQVRWKTYTVPSTNPTGNPDSNAPCTGTGSANGDNGPTGCDYTGGAVWATPTIDPQTGQVFVATGNNYTTPDGAATCAQNDQNANPPIDDSNCTAPNDFFDSVLALNLKTGAINWGHKVQGYDAWSVACFFNPPGGTWCPSPSSPDYDFGGSSPNLFTGKGPHGTTQTLVGDGQKSGIYWAFDPITGAPAWHRLIGPGTTLGGIEWGSAYDGLRLYTPEANPTLFGPPNTYTLCCGGGTASGGSWAALDPKTGAFGWQTAVPGDYAALGPVSVADGVLFGGSMAPGATDPNMFALDASNGKILWSFPAGGSVNAGPAIVNGVVYWGSGYAHLGPFFTGNNKFYAFSINGK
jgi:polyvinyl alcohol dehydrogenase (cytochrome)